MMHTDIIEIKFKGPRRERFVNSEHLQFKVGDFAIVQAEKGIDFGRINQISSLLKSEDKDQKLKKIIRKSNENDFRKMADNHQKEIKALQVCKDKLANHDLNMKLVDCEYQYDGKKITFHFTSENRVDFRKLVKDIAAIYRTRIEFRQIGVRDEARRLTGYGVCGRPFCCTCWIKDFMPVTTQSAKEQNLPLNPTKLAGVCGRLKCCLIFERDFYNQATKEYPELAMSIKTARGEGLVTNIDIFNEKVTVSYPDESTEVFPLEQVKEQLQQCEEKCQTGEDSCDALTLGENEQ